MSEIEWPYPHLDRPGRVLEYVEEIHGVQVCVFSYMADGRGLFSSADLRAKGVPVVREHQVRLWYAAPVREDGGTQGYAQQYGEWREGAPRPTLPRSIGQMRRQADAELARALKKTPDDRGGEAPASERNGICPAYNPEYSTTDGHEPESEKVFRVSTIPRAPMSPDPLYPRPEDAAHVEYARICKHCRCLYVPEPEEKEDE